MSSFSTDTPNTRTAILNRLRRSSAREPGREAEHQETAATIKPAAAAVDSVEQFKTVLAAHKAELHPLETLNDLPAFMAQWLTERDLPLLLHTGNHPTLTDLPWSTASITLSTQPFLEDGQVALSTALCGIVETGTLVLTSGPANPTRNNFLAAHHLIIVAQDQLVDSSEQAWQLIHKHFDTLPRAVNFISGPSSSADVGLKLEYGAHGPGSLTVLLTP